MSLNLLANHFKSETRSAGNTYIKKGKVMLTQSTDTQIQAYVRTATSFKVVLTSESIESDTILANCICPKSKKGQLCKHIWAVLATVVEQGLDFLESKTEIQNIASGTSDTSSKPAYKPAPTASQEAYKQKQADYKKAQYEKQKERAKNYKQAKKNKSENYPSEVLAALKYFEDNGFPLNQSLSREAIAVAKKKLANVFHPDKGGSHDEILELNKISAILWDFVNK